MPGPEKQFDPEVALEAAMRVFWAHGFQAASLSELMAAMGISKKSLYDTFGNKRQLFIKALNHYVRISCREIQAELNRGTSPLRNLNRLLKKWQKQAGEPGSVGCMIGTNIADFNTDDEEIAELLRSAMSRIEDMFFENLKAARSAGELKEDINPRELARMTVAMAQGTALMGRVLDSPKIPNSIGSGLMSLIAAK